VKDFVALFVGRDCRGCKSKVSSSNYDNPKTNWVVISVSLGTERIWSSIEPGTRAVHTGGIGSYPHGLERPNKSRDVAALLQEMCGADRTGALRLWYYRISVLEELSAKGWTATARDQ
jgi:hypothetical protein